MRKDIRDVVTSPLEKNAIELLAESSEKANNDTLDDESWKIVLHTMKIVLDLERPTPYT